MTHLDPSRRALARSALARSALVALAAAAALGLAACGEDAPAPPETFTLTVTGTGTGSGIVVSTPAGINCQITNGAAAATGCTGTFTAGTSVGLLASPGLPTLEFGGWGAPCAGTDACNVTVSANTTVAAGFRPRVQTLTVALQAPANRDDGAILLTVSGPTILALRPGPGLEMAEVRDAPGAGGAGVARSRLLLRGLIAPGALLQLDVPGSASASQYSASVQQVAARASGNYAQRADVAAYQLTIR